MKLDGLNIEDDFYFLLCLIFQVLDVEFGKFYQGGIDYGMYNLLRGKVVFMLEIFKV